MDNQSEQPFDAGKLHKLLINAGVSGFEGCNSRGVIFFAESATDADRTLAQQVIADYTSLLSSIETEPVTLEALQDRIAELERIIREGQ